MPNTHASSTSGLNARCFKLSAERLYPTTTAGFQGSCSRISSVVERIAGAGNVPRGLTTDANSGTRHCAGHTMATLPQPVLGNGWTVRGAPFPTGAHPGTRARGDHVRPVLLALSVACSDYWRQSLGGRALCVRHDDGRIACRVSPATDGGVAMLASDAVIQLTGDGPEPYSSLLRWTLENSYQVEPFCSAAVQAAQLAVPSLANWSAETFHADMARHEKALNESMVTWIYHHHDYLEQVAAQMMRAGPAVT